MPKELWWLNSVQWTQSRWAKKKTIDRKYQHVPSLLLIMLSLCGTMNSSGIIIIINLLWWQLSVCTNSLFYDKLKYHEQRQQQLKSCFCMDERHNNLCNHKYRRFPTICWSLCLWRTSASLHLTRRQTVRLPLKVNVMEVARIPHYFNLGSWISWFTFIRAVDRWSSR